MDLELYVIIIAVVALIYSFIARALQFKIGNRIEMQALQKESKKLNEELKEAKKGDNETKVNDLMKKQMELFPKMSKLMLGQFKVMFVIIAIFLACTWAVGQFDPTINDDVVIELNDAGLGCDKIAGDGVYTECYKLEEGSEGLWNVGIQLHSSDGGIIGENKTSFIYETGDISKEVLRYKGEMIGVVTDKTLYHTGDEIIIYSTPSKDGKVTAIIDQGTFFFVDLPFTIPILNVQRIGEVYWWFIFVSLISGLLLSVILNKIKGGSK